MENYSGLTLFNKVVHHGSFVKAAQAVGLTPSAVSKAISRLEDSLGVLLFYRTTRSLTLTEAGAEYFRRSEGILAAISEAEAIVSDLGVSPRGDLHVSCSDGFAAEVIVPMLPSFGERFPRIRVHVSPGDGPVDLAKEHFDVAIRFERPEIAGFLATKLVDDPWVVCASPGYLEQFGKPKSPDALTDHRCIVIRARGVADSEWSFFKNKQQRVSITPVFSGIGLVAKQAALSGVGIARLARYLVRAEIKQGNLVPLLTRHSPKLERAIFSVTPNLGHLPEKNRVFTEALIQHLA